MPDTVTVDAGTAPEFTPSVDVGREFPPGYDPSRPKGLPGSEFKPGQPSRGYDPVDVQARVRKRLLESGLPPVAVQGILRRLDKESQFNPGAIGDGGTSYGLMQAHNEPGNKASQRMDDLLAFAKERKTSPDNPELQADFIVHELDTRFPGLKKDLVKATDSDVAYNQFTKVYENPAQTMVMRDANGNVVIGNSELSFSPGRGRGAISMMSPEDFLALAGDGDFPNERKRKSLMQSLAAGEPIEEFPSLDVKHKAGEPTGTVTDADGRHRALAAQEAGLSSIPVEMNGAQDGLTELTGQQGKTLPVSAPRSGGLMNWLVPSAQAQEIVRDKFGGVRVQAAPPVAPTTTETVPAATDKFGGTRVPAQGDQPDPYAGMYYGASTPRAEMAGAVRGLVDPPLGALQGLAETGVQAGIPGAPWAAQNMLRAIQGVHELTDPAIARSPIAGETGELAGLMPYVLLARRLFGPRAAQQVVQRGFWPAVRSIAMGSVIGAGTGAVSGAMAPEDVSGDEYWQQKGSHLPLDALFGGSMGMAFNMLGAIAGPIRQRMAERAEQQAMLAQLPNIRDLVVEPRRQIIMRTPVSRANITPIMQQYIESPQGQRAIRDEIERARKDVLGHGAAFNEARFGIRQQPNNPRIRDIFPPVAGTTSGTTPSLRFLDAIRQQQDRDIEVLQGKLRAAPNNMDIQRNLNTELNSRRQYTDELRRQFPDYNAYLDMTDAVHLVGRTLQDEGIEGVRRMLGSSEGFLRAIGNLGYGSHGHMLANAMHSVVRLLRPPGLSPNQLRQLHGARQQLPGMPPMRAAQSANALQRLIQSMGTGAAAVEPQTQMVPGL